MQIEIETIIQLLIDRGNEEYGDDGINQLEHALQCATLAESCGANQQLIVASLLHDIGHLLHPLRYQGDRNDRHEHRALPVLQQLFSTDITEPIHLHVDAKRYLCAINQDYWSTLSSGSQQTLKLQGGIFSAPQAAAFIAQPHAIAAVQLRQWDDRAKIVGLQTPDLTHFLPIVTACLQ